MYSWKQLYVTFETVYLIASYEDQVFGISFLGQARKKSLLVIRMRQRSLFEMEVCEGCRSTELACVTFCKRLSIAWADAVGKNLQREPLMCSVMCLFSQNEYKSDSESIQSQLSLGLTKVLEF